MCVFNYSGSLIAKQCVACSNYITQREARGKSYYTTTSCTNVYTRALSPEETREGVKFLETKRSSADSDMHGLQTGKWLV